MGFESEVTLPAALQAYSYGQLVDFDTVRLQVGILHFKRRTLPLNEIARMTLDAGIFKVYSSSKNQVFLKLDVSKIANMLTLFQMLQSLTAPMISTVDGERA